MGGPKTYQQRAAKAWKELARSERTMALVMASKFQELQLELLKSKRKATQAKQETRRWRMQAEAAADLANIPPILATRLCPHCRYVEGTLRDPCVYHALEVVRLAAKADPLEPITRIRPRLKPNEGR